VTLLLVGEFSRFTTFIEREGFLVMQQSPERTLTQVLLGWEGPGFRLFFIAAVRARIIAISGREEPLAFLLVRCSAQPKFVPLSIKCGPRGSSAPIGRSTCPLNPASILVANDVHRGTLKEPKQCTMGPKAILSESGQGSETLLSTACCLE
jgi:hypothetical protein